MKKSYREQFDNIHLRDDHKEDILNSILNYEAKEKRRFFTKPTLSAVALSVLLLFSTLLLANHMFGGNAQNSFVIQANDDVFKIYKSTIEINNFEKSVTGYIMGSDKGLIKSNPMSAPLNVMIKGKNIKSITYTISNGEFYKFEEDYDGDRYLTNNNEGERCYGCLFIRKEANTFPKLTDDGMLYPGDNNKKNWRTTLKSNSNEITIDYDKQSTIDSVYGISFSIGDRELFEEWMRASKDSEQEAQALAAVDAQIISVINRSVLDVRVDYKDGTYETTQLKFKAEANKNTQITK